MRELFVTLSLLALFGTGAFTASAADEKAKAVAASPTGTYEGQLTGVDPMARTVVVQCKTEGASAKTVLMDVDETAQISKDGAKTVLSDLKEGEQVSVEYATVDGSKTVKSIKAKSK